MSDKPPSRRWRWYEAEVALCRRATRAQVRPASRRFFRTVSRLGDGPIWFALALLLPLVGGGRALPTVARMAAVGIVAALVSRTLKIWISRPRPFLVHAGIPAAGTPLDRWSFPSGHTLHAVAFTIVVVAGTPGLAWLLVPFTLAVAASRVVLGLHYPSDVAAGALIGGLLGSVVLAVL